VAFDSDRQFSFISNKTSSSRIVNKFWSNLEHEIEGAISGALRQVRARMPGELLNTQVPSQGFELVQAIFDGVEISAGRGSFGI
jgi:hypothetical protein